MNKTDVLIIGGGAVGVCAAYYLREAGYEVTLVERGEIGSGASHGNMGLVVPSHSVPLAAPGVVSQGLKWMFRPDSPFYIKPRLDPSLIRWLWAFWRASSEGRMRRAIPLIRDMSLQSLTLFDELNGLDGVDFDYHQRGVLAVYQTREGQEEGEEERHLLSSYGLEIDALSPDGLSEALTGAGSECVGRHALQAGRSFDAGQVCAVVGGPRRAARCEGAYPGGSKGFHERKRTHHSYPHDQGGYRGGRSGAHGGFLVRRTW